MAVSENFFNFSLTLNLVQGISYRKVTAIAGVLLQKIQELVNMRISEAAKMTGLSVSNIRFYEKKGLLAPVRQEESKYRDYSMEDIEELKKIILLRKMDVSVESIYLMKNGEASLVNVLMRQEEELTARMEMLQGSIDLCRQILKEQDPENIDFDYYLNYVKEEEAQGRRFAEVEELLEDLAEFSRMTQFRGDPYVGRFFSNVWVARGLSVILAVCALLIPLSAIIRGLGSGTKDILAQGAVVFWVLWLLALCLSWAGFRRRKR